MSEGVAVLSILGNDRWNTDVYASLSAASQVSSALKVGALRLKLFYSLHVLNSRLQNFFDELYKATENPNPTSGRTATLEQAQEAAATLRRLSAQLDDSYDRAKRCRLTNSSFWAGSLSRLHTYAEDLTELSEWIEMLIEPRSYEDAFKRAAEEKEQGRVYSLSQVD